jgi:hypothetical protein
MNPAATGAALGRVLEPGTARAQTRHPEVLAKRAAHSRDGDQVFQTMVITDSR